MSLQVIECPQVDLISPFPVSEAHRLRGWLYCYKSLIIDDQTSGTEDELEAYLTAILSSPNMISWGIIDKFNQVNSKHEAPLVGFIGYEPMGAFNGYFHVASNRSCWGKGFVDEAGRAAISAVFQLYPSVLRVSAAMLDRNKPAKALAHRLGFERDGRFENFTQQNGQPQAVIHFGITRNKWEELCQQQENSLSPSPALEPASFPESEQSQAQQLAQPLVPSAPAANKAE